jgi:hypothetical protein
MSSYEIAQNGRGIERAAKDLTNSFLCLAPRIRALCAP